MILQSLTGSTPAFITISPTSNSGQSPHKSFRESPRSRARLATGPPVNEKLPKNEIGPRIDLVPGQAIELVIEAPEPMEQLPVQPEALVGADGDVAGEQAELGLQGGEMVQPLILIRTRGLGSHILCLEICINREISTKLDKARKSQHFRETYKSV